MLYVRFLSSLSPPLDTFATLSKVYRPSQTPHPAVSSIELLCFAQPGMSTTLQHSRRLSPVWGRPPYTHTPTRSMHGKGGFNRLKTVEALHLPSPLRDEAGGDPPAALPPPVGHGNPTGPPERLVQALHPPDAPG